MNHNHYNEKKKKKKQLDVEREQAKNSHLPKIRDRYDNVECTQAHHITLFFQCFLSESVLSVFTLQAIKPSQANKQTSAIYSHKSINTHINGSMKRIKQSKPKKRGKEEEEKIREQKTK